MNPPTIPGASRTSSGRRGLAVLGAATLAVTGLAVGTGVIRLPTAVPGDAPSLSAAIVSAPAATPATFASPTANAPTPSPLPQQPQRGGPAQPLTRDVLAATQTFLMASGRIGWDATDTGVFRTGDAGQTWVDVAPDGWTASAATAFVDADTAYLASDSLPMIMAATHDGGRTWVTSTIDDPKISGGPMLSFRTPTRGFATFFEGRGETHLRVYATVDGGRSWTGPALGRTPTIEASLGEIKGPSGGILYLWSDKYSKRPFNNHFVISQDGGATWKTRTFPIGGPSPKAAQKSIAGFWPEADGAISVAIGAGERGSIWSSTDGGATWQLVKALPRDVEVDSADFVSPSEWVFRLIDGSGFRSTVDTGAHWRKVKTIDGVEIVPGSVSFGSADVGWGFELCQFFHRKSRDCAGHEEPVLAATTNGGRTWSLLGGRTPEATASPSPDGATWSAAGTVNAGGTNVRGPGLSAVSLLDGRVLVFDGGPGLGTDVYDPRDGRWRSSGPVLHSRDGQTATLLPDGRVFVAGGSDDKGPRATTEIYDPATGRWTRGPSMHRRRTNFGAVALIDGRVLVVGGDAYARPAITAEVYDPRTGRWALTGAPRKNRSGAALVVLQDGRVLMAGGSFGDRRSASAELYDPATGIWTETRRMLEARDHPSATRLLDGRVLVVGGALSFAGRERPTAELFDPTTGQWSTTGAMSEARTDRATTLLADGRVLVSGGVVRWPVAIASAEVYDPVTGTWSPTARLATARFGHAAVRLADGSVLVVGGHATGWFQYLGSAERYYPNGQPAG